MFRILCLLAVLGLGRCLDHVPSREEIEASINRTIEEVEKKVQADPSLPRLSRKDIVDILHNITTKDLISYGNKTLENTRNDYQRALMVVLPYNTNGSNESLEELYTKPPMVKMVSDDLDTNDNENQKFELPSENLITIFPTSNSVNAVSTTKDHHKHFEGDQRLDKRPERFSFDLEKLAKVPVTTEKPLHTWKPIPKKTTNTPDSAQSSSSGYVDYNTKVSTTDKPISKPTQHILSSDQWSYHAPPTTPKARYPLPQKGFFLPTMQSTLDERNKEENKKQELFTLFEDSDVMTEHSSPIYVTPMSESKPKSVYTLAAGGFLSSTTPPPMRKEVEDLLQSIGLRPMQNDDKKLDLIFDQKLLDSKFQIPDTSNVIQGQVTGLTAADIKAASIIDQNTFDNSDTKFKKGVDNLTPSVQLLFQKFGLQTSLNAEASTSTTTTTTVKPTLPGYNSYSNFKPLPNSAVQDKEMRDFLARFGLGVGESRSQKAISPRKNTREEPPSLIEAVPGNMKRILENIGLITKSRARSEVGSRKEINVQTTAAPQLHVFKPHETSVFNDKQRSKINELLETVKKVQRGKANVEEVQRVADEVLETTKSLPEGPDPASLEEILKLYKEDLRNEVKRQQAAEEYEKKLKEEKEEAEKKEAEKEEAEREKKEGEEKKANEEKDSMGSAQELLPASVTTTTAATTSKGSFFDNFDIDAVLKNAQENSDGTSTSSSASATLPNLTALEESFGGTTKKPDPVVPTRRRTGLYFLVDWNTFLEVGEEGKDKVNLKFQPKVGDRTRFVKVTVP
ncbi:uncharacterized protein DDB_G0284459 isoform X2 [Belonocnema kinseyi]|uniref:uncharacterized protein DDB_G0284459 isoform X2 n=1 Tax=Belonocnema kinseyi TaxID=2817044 RepID=UPI00143D070C|nr:uncharacterized protein DDB_G0284459 isoform X2 [Belonocnema kinseyi]